MTCIASNESGTLTLSGGRDGKLCLWQWGKDHFFHQVLLQYLFLTICFIIKVQLIVTDILKEKICNLIK